MRLKVPPAIAQFQHTLDRNTAAQTFKLLNKYRPETKVQKKERLLAEATAVEQGKKKEDASKVRALHHKRLYINTPLKQLSFIYLTPLTETLRRQIRPKPCRGTDREQEGVSSPDPERRRPDRARRIPARAVPQDGCSLRHHQGQGSPGHRRAQEDRRCCRAHRGQGRGQVRA